MFKLSILGLALCALSFAQTASYDGTAVRGSHGPNNVQYAQQFAYDGSGNLIFKGTAPQNQPTTYWTVAAATLVDCVDATNTMTCTTSAAHGLSPKNQVVLAGVSADTDANGTYQVQTVPSSTTFTVTTASVTDGTYTDAGMIFSTTAPLTTKAIWFIEAYTYNGSNQLIRYQTSLTLKQIWDNRAVTTGTTQVNYN